MPQRAAEPNPFPWATGQGKDAGVMRAFGIFLLFLLLPAAAQGQRSGSSAPVAVGESSGLVVPGIEVETEGKTSQEARMNGWREAQRLAWPVLWSRLSGLPAGQAPRLPDSALDNIVAAIEVEREAVRDKLYAARLSVVFDRARAAPFLGSYAGFAQSPPMLLLPVLQDAATRSGYDPDSPWVEAWIRFRAGESAIDYIRLRAGPSDTLLLSAFQAERPDIAIWRQLIERYQVADVLVPELILERGLPGAPATALLITRFGPGGREVGRVRLNNARGDIAALMDAAVREADTRFTAALRSGLLVPDPALAPPEPVEVPDLGPEIGREAQGRLVEIDVETPTDAALSAIEARLREVPGVTAVQLRSFVIGGTSRLALRTLLEPEDLALALEAEGLRLEGNRLRVLSAGAARQSQPQAPPPASPQASPPPAERPGAGEGVP